MFLHHLIQCADMTFGAKCFKNGRVKVGNDGCGDEIPSPRHRHVFHHAVRHQGRLCEEANNGSEQDIGVDWLLRRLVKLFINEFNCGDTMVQGLCFVVYATILGQV